jgi:hypothetical protein
MAQSRLRSLGEGDTSEFFTTGVDAPPSSPVENAATSVLFTALKALSQRTVIALSQLFVLATALSAFWLWMVTMPQPTILQLVGLGLYAIMILILDWMVLRGM